VDILQLKLENIIGLKRLEAEEVKAVEE